MMTELTKIFDHWYMENSEKDTLKDDTTLWIEMQTFIYEYCTPSQYEKLTDYLLSFSRQIEQNAFIAGYKKAYHLLSELSSNTM